MSKRFNPSRDVWFWAIVLSVLSAQVFLVARLIRNAGAEVPVGYGVGLRFLNIVVPICLALVVRFFLRRRQVGSSGAAARTVFDRWWDLPLLVLAFVLVAESYVWAKVFVPAVNSRLWDRELADLSTALNFGVHPNVALLTVLEGSPGWAAGFLDAFYTAFVPTMLAATAWFATDRPARRRAFLIGFIVLWSAGFWWYLLMPCLGPVYVDQGIAAEVKELFPVSRFVQHELAENYQNVLSTLAGAPAPIMPTRGVAAMPSLHVGAQALFLFWCVWLRTKWRTFFLVMMMLTFVGSVATGWHWYVDGWAGIALAALAAAVAIGVDRLQEPESAEDEA